MECHVREVCDDFHSVEKCWEEWKDNEEYKLIIELLERNWREFNMPQELEEKKARKRGLEGNVAMLEGKLEYL